MKDGLKVLPRLTLGLAELIFSRVHLEKNTDSPEEKRTPEAKKVAAELLKVYEAAGRAVSPLDFLRDLSNNSELCINLHGNDVGYSDNELCLRTRSEWFLPWKIFLNFSVHYPFFFHPTFRP